MLNTNVKSYAAKSIAACALGFTLMIGGSGVAIAATQVKAASNAPAATQTATHKKTYIGTKRALKYALKDAKLSVKECTDIEKELDRDDGKIHYDVSFKAHGYEYDYDIDVYSGKILSREIEVDD